jgi:hypothetical protein
MKIFRPSVRVSRVYGSPLHSKGMTYGVSDTDREVLCEGEGCDRLLGEGGLEILADLLSRS